MGERGVVAHDRFTFDQKVSQRVLDSDDGWNVLQAKEKRKMNRGREEKTSEGCVRLPRVSSVRTEEMGRVIGDNHGDA